MRPRQRNPAEAAPAAPRPAEGESSSSSSRPPDPPAAAEDGQPAEGLELEPAERRGRGPDTVARVRRTYREGEAQTSNPAGGPPAARGGWEAFGHFPRWNKAMWPMAASTL